MPGAFVTEPATLGLFDQTFYPIVSLTGTLDGDLMSLTPLPVTVDPPWTFGGSGMQTIGCYGTPTVCSGAASFEFDNLFFTVDGQSWGLYSCEVLTPDCEATLTIMLPTDTVVNPNLTGYGTDSVAFLAVEASLRSSSRRKRQSSSCLGLAC